jgi:hypothetical protein
MAEHKGDRMVKPLVQHLFDSLRLNVWPDGPAAITDCGIDSKEHYEALAVPVRKGEIKLDDLDRAYGNGPLLTVLARQAPSNPNKSIVFETPWDFLRPPKERGTN